MTLFRQAELGLQSPTPLNVNTLQAKRWFYTTTTVYFFQISCRVILCAGRRDISRIKRYKITRNSQQLKTNITRIGVFKNGRDRK